MSKAIPIVLVVIFVIAGVLMLQHGKQKDRQQALAIKRQQQVQTEKRRAFLGALPKLNIQDWKGKSPTALAPVFPTAKNLNNVSKEMDSDDCDIANYKGWDRLTLTFTNYALGAVSVDSPVVLTEADAQHVAQNCFGIALPRENYFQTPAERGFENLKGKVKTVTFVEEQAQGKKGGASIAIFEAAKRAPTANYRVRSIVFTFGP